MVQSHIVAAIHVQFGIKSNTTSIIINIIDITEAVVLLVIPVILVTHAILVIVVAMVMAMAMATDTTINRKFV